MSNTKKPAFNADAAEEYFSDLLFYYKKTGDDIFNRDNEGRHSTNFIYSAEYQKYVGMQIAMREVLEYFSKYDLADVQEILGEDYDLDRLRELVEADRDERCHVIVLSGQEDGPSRCDPVGPPGNPGVPVIGEMVWIIEPYEDDEPEVTGYVLIGMNDKYAFLSPKVNDETDPYDLCVYYYGCFYDYAEAEGIAVWPINECYLSKEAAEAVLKGRCQNENF